MPKQFFVVLVIAVAAVLAGCDASAEVSIGGKSIDREDVETTVAAGLAEQANLPEPGVDCEGIDEIDVEANAKFTCEGTAPNGDKFPIEITLTDEEGGFRYFVPNSSGPADGSGSGT